MSDTHSTDTKPVTLTEDVGNLANRLDAVRDRIGKLGAALHGPMPMDDEAGSPTPPEVPSVRGIIDAAFRTLVKIESELSRVEARL